jgi:hypothetical protein
MNVISSTFWGEGPSDDRFLPKLIQRTLEAILYDCARGEWEVLEPYILKSRETSFVRQVADIATQSAGFTLAFVHTDSDAPDERDRAIPYKISPALEQVTYLEPNDACKNIIAVIPVTKIENWKLADLEALQELLGVQMNWTDLGLNIGIQQLEQRADSKELLSAAFRAATALRGRRRNQFTLEDLDESLAKRISLQNIARYDSFQRFLGRLTASLIEQNIIREDCETDLR